MKTPEEVLSFWFGTLDEQGMASPEKAKRWWTKSPDFDDAVRSNFEPTLSALGDGVSLDAWRQKSGAPRRDALVAGVVLTDQMSRNMYRDSSRMYDFDALAQGFSHELIALRHYEELPLALRVAAYMPLMHSEDAIAQAACCSLFEELVADFEGVGLTQCVEAAKENLRYAVMHREIVDKFGRFPHRNEILSRASTTEEKAFLKEPGSSF